MTTPDITTASTALLAALGEVVARTEDLVAAMAAAGPSAAGGDRGFLTIAETAEVFRVSDDLVSDLIARGDLPAAQLGRRKVVPRIAVDQIIAEALRDFDPAVAVQRVGAATPRSEWLIDPQP